jgi:hypothetical protein
MQIKMLWPDSAFKFCINEAPYAGGILMLKSGKS